MTDTTKSKIQRSGGSNRLRTTFLLQVGPPRSNFGCLGAQKNKISSESLTAHFKKDWGAFASTTTGPSQRALLLHLSPSRAPLRVEGIAVQPRRVHLVAEVLLGGEGPRVAKGPCCQARCLRSWRPSPDVLSRTLRSRTIAFSAFGALQIGLGPCSCQSCGKRGRLATHVH